MNFIFKIHNQKFEFQDSEFKVSNEKLFLLFFILVLLYLPQKLHAQNKPCQFDEKTLQFVGKPVEQARCLLRPNKIGGVLGEELKKLPKPLENLIGKKVKIKKDNLRKYLQGEKVNETVLGGSLTQSLSDALLSNGKKIPALYFIIHDTSSPYLRDESFPPEFDTNPDWSGNNLSVWIKQPVAHVFVNRLGESLTIADFGETVKKGWGTKFAREVLKGDGKGLQLHIELIQPRRRKATDPNPQNDLIAPLPGFTDKQYERLALLYICASLRRGTWLVPAYHSAIDAGIKDAHDDPQNFELDKFAAQIKFILKKIR